MQASALDWTIVRPPWIFGPGDADTLDLFKMARRGFVVLHTLLNAKLLESVDPQRRGSAFGALLFAFDAGIGLGSFSLGWVIGHHGYRLGWGLGAVAMLAALPTALRLGKD